LSADKLKEAVESTERLVKQAEAAFAVMPVDVPEFTPAAWLIRNPKVLDAKTGAVPKTLDRAQTIFEAYNKLLWGCCEAQARLVAGPGSLCVLRQPPGELLSSLHAPSYPTPNHVDHNGPGGSRRPFSTMGHTGAILVGRTCDQDLDFLESGGNHQTHAAWPASMI